MPAQWDRDALLAHPAFESLRPVLALCPVDRFPTPQDLSRLAHGRGLSSGGGVALRFVGASNPAPHGVDTQYEVRAYRDGQVSTRPGSLHDLFNALAWLAFPRTKALLNRRHYEHMVEQRGGSRGTARDVLTLFDESGMIVACSEPELGDLLRGFRWKELFWSRRAEVTRAMRFLTFGHAIHEKAMWPYKALTARALIVAVPHHFFGMTLDAQLEDADARAALCLSAQEALDTTHRLAPLPIQGIPGWEPANACASFYDDVSVFRPGRGQK
jgi:hypothetical protein